ncbi:MAG: proton-conducting transporter membrane subunit [Candidatus Wildermuthbacteria bacterium]|nr:proton-conducting transporter membrane subunit [Candidatus Wildermuthbacteria bacterium]
MLILFAIITPVVASFASLLVRKNQVFLYVFAAVASLIELIAVSVIVLNVATHGHAFSWTPYFEVDALGAIVMMLVAVIGLAASWYSMGYLRAEVVKGIIGFRRVRQYFVLLHLFLVAMFLAISTTNPVLMWIAIEATTLSTAFLISFYNKPSAMEAAWKYLIINSVGLLLGFFGTLLFVYPALSISQGGFIDWHAVAASVANFDPILAKIAFILVLIGYGTKVGLVPMHTWLPDAHSKAPVPISSLLSGVLLNVAFLAILRFKSVTDAVVGNGFSQDLLIFFGLTSIVVASFIIFAQKNYKRLLAYSSIEHMGIIALGFGFGGAAIFASLLHMVYHSLAKSILFLCSGSIFLRYSTTKIVNVRGMILTLPVTAILFIIGFLAITGVPPSGTFLTEFSIMASGIQDHMIVVAVAVFALVVAFIGFLRHIVSMVFGEVPSGIVKGESTMWIVAPIILLVCVFLFLSVFIPGSMEELLRNAVLNTSL